MYLIKVSVKESRIEGKGVFADEAIKKDAIVWKFDVTHDKSLSKEEFDKLNEEQKTTLLRVAYFSSKSNLWVFPPENDPALYTNHSTSNNLSAIYNEDLSQEPLFKANRDIRVGEELTVDYTEFDTRPEKQVLGWK